MFSVDLGYIAMSAGKRRLKPTLQIAQTECGLCCVRTILEAYDYQVTLTELRQVREPGRDGLGLQQIKDLLLHYNIDAKTYRIKDVKAFEIIDFPVIAYWKSSHYICVESYNSQEVVIMDPSIGRMKISHEDFMTGFSGYIVGTSPGKDFEKRRIKGLSRWTKKYIWPSHMADLYVKVAFASLFLVGITLAVPVLTQNFIDHGFGSSVSFVKILVGLILSIFVMVGVTFFRTQVSIKMVCRFSWHLLSGAFNRVVSLPAKYFTVRAPGEIVYRLNALTRIQDVLGTKLVQAVLDLISGVSLLIYVFWTSPLMGLIILLFTFATVIFLVVAQPFVTAATDIELHEGSKSQSIELDAVVSINSVKLGGYVESYIKDWETNYKRMLNALSRRMRIQQGIIGSILSGVQVFFPLIILVISLYMAENNVISLGQSIAIQSVTSLVFSFANSVFSTLTDSLVAVRYIELAEDTFEYPVERTDGTSFEISSGAVRLENLSFRYTPDSPPAIEDISLDIADGETVAFVGLSGSGKTTLAKVISSLFEPTDGHIYFDGIEYSKWKLESLREAIGYIPQEVHLHNRTIMENLKLGCKKSEEEIRSICDNLPFLEFIKSFPMGYNTMTSEMGASLSGGQRQRIHVAKILLQNPRLLILDEATSSLDNISQAQVYEELSKLKCTKVVIAHRLGTVLNADRIVVLQDGHIEQSGVHEELVAVDGPYAKLFEAELKRS